jgi:hypothetical protein
MFEQLSAWDSKISLRGAMLDAIGFGFVAGMAFGVAVLRLVLLHVPLLNLTRDLLYIAVALALAVRFYLLAMSRVRESAAKLLLTKDPVC